MCYSGLQPIEALVDLVEVTVDVVETGVDACFDAVHSVADDSLDVGQHDLAVEPCEERK